MTSAVATGQSPQPTTPIGARRLPAQVTEALETCISTLRADAASGREPWVAMRDRCVLTHKSDSLWLLADLLHLGRSVPASLIPADLADLLQSQRLVTRSADRLIPDRWELTSHHGVLAVRDRSSTSGEGAVYLGEDGLTFLEAVLAARPTGHVLEIGSGTGIVSSGAARTADYVTAVDIVPECLDATRVTAWLNGVAERLVAVPGDVMAENFSDEFGGRFDCVAANLPGVPVPTGLHYSPAGDGGPDGLRLIRRMLEIAPSLLRGSAVPKTSTAVSPAVLMRYQSLGDDEHCFLLETVRAWAVNHGFDVLLTYTSRVPVEVRNGLTARYATPRNPGVRMAAIMETLDDHVASLGATQFYSATLVARSGQGRVDVVDAALPSLLDTRLNVDATNPARVQMVLEGRFFPRLSDLAEGYWEMGTIEEVRRVAGSSNALLGLLAAGYTARQAFPVLHGDAVEQDRAAARSLLSVTVLLLQTLLSAGCVQAAVLPASDTNDQS